MNNQIMMALLNVMPNYIITNDNGVDKILNFQISNESSQARIIEIIDKFGSFYFNVIPVLDGNTLKDIMNYLKFHPLLILQFQIMLC